MKASGSSETIIPVHISKGRHIPWIASTKYALPSETQISRAKNTFSCLNQSITGKAIPLQAWTGPECAIR